MKVKKKKMIEKQEVEPIAEFFAHSPEYDIKEWTVVINYGSDLAFSLLNWVYKIGTDVFFLDYQAATDELLQQILDNHNVVGFVLSGSSSNSVFKEGAPLISPVVYQSGKPVLAICYSAQAVAYAAGCEVDKNEGDEEEKGPSKLIVHEDSILWRGLDTNFLHVHMWHKYEPKAIPNGFRHTASTKLCKYAAFEKDNIYCLHFHPEFELAVTSKRILVNFIKYVCGVAPVCY